MSSELLKCKMSDQSESHQHADIDHSSFLSENFNSLLFSENYSDVTLIVEGERIPAHKLVLAVSCDYFRALLYGGLMESGQKEVVLQTDPLKGFKHIMRYIYTGRLCLSGLKEDIVLDILELSHQYGFEKLQEAVCKFLQKILSIRNVCTVYDKAQLYNFKELFQTCCSYMDQNASVILHSDFFLSLSASAVREILARDSFCAKEIDIFVAVQRWCAENEEAEGLNEILREVRLPLMETNDLLGAVRRSGLIEPDRLLDAIQRRTECKDVELNYRGSLLPGENVATVLRRAQVITGELRQDLLEVKTSRTYDLDRGFTRHNIEDKSGITIKLGEPCIINHIIMRLWDKDPRSYSYYIEVSMNMNDWYRIIDHSTFLCRSLQKLYFKPRVVLYIRIVGTHSAANNVFYLVSFEAKYTDMEFKLKDGIFVPEKNVASAMKNACVVEGVSRSRNALINGDFAVYDWDCGYTCHQVGAGSIIVQLPQPYMVDSIRMLLWDRDSRSYSYYIETSVDKEKWTKVADRSQQLCRSWQILTFQALPVVFIKIIGTHNTVNEVFHCVHFECPAQVRSLEECAQSAEESPDVSD